MQHKCKMQRTYAAYAWGWAKRTAYALAVRREPGVTEEAEEQGDSAGDIAMRCALR